MKVSSKILKMLIQNGHKPEGIIVDPKIAEGINAFHKRGLNAKINHRAVFIIKTYKRYGDVFAAKTSSPTKTIAFKNADGIQVQFIDNLTCEAFCAAHDEWSCENDVLTHSSVTVIEGVQEDVDPVTLFSSFDKKGKFSGTISVIEVRDSSGSMDIIYDPFIKAVNTELAALQEINRIHDRQTYIHSLVEFDRRIVTRHTEQPIQDVLPLDNSFRFMGGSTALKDAIGRAIELSKSQNADKYIILITTDGEENCSRKYSWDMLKNDISELNATGKYTFVLCGPKKDAWGGGSYRTADRLGIDHSNVHPFENTKESVAAMANRRTEAYTSYAVKTSLGESTTISFFDEL